MTDMKLMILIVKIICYCLTEMGLKRSQERRPGGMYDDLKNELHLGEEDWDVATASQSVSAPPSYASSGGSHDDWSKTIEDLDSITHNAADMMRKLEQSLALETGECRDVKKPGGQGGALTDNALSELCGDGNVLGSVKLRPKRGGGGKQGREHRSQPDIPDLALLQGQQYLSPAEMVNEAELHLQEVEEQLQNIFTPTPIELCRITLYKYSESENFGFSLSDGVYEKGVYISAIRPGGPAEKCGNLLPFDRILQINDFKLQEQDCSEAIPMIARSGNELSLVISRNPLAFGTEDSSDIWELQSDAGSYRSQTV